MRYFYSRYAEIHKNKQMDKYYIIFNYTRFGVFKVILFLTIIDIHTSKLL